MCYSERVSAFTFLAVTGVCVYLWRRAVGLDKPIALILFLVVLMQAIEWVLWRNTRCNTMNKLMSAIIPIYLTLQPIIANAIVGYYDAGWAGGYTTLAGILSLALPYKVHQAVKEYGVCSTVSPAGHLIWPRPILPDDSVTGSIGRLLYYASFVYPLVTLKNTTFSALYVGFAVLSLGMSGYKEKGSWPSLWCHFVNALAAFAVLRPGV